MKTDIEISKQSTVPCENEQYGCLNTSSEQPAPSEATVSTPEALADRYQFLHQIGKGAQGDIYKARKLDTQEIVAIKQLRIDQVEDWKSYVLFEREAEVLSKLDMPGIAKFHEAIQCLNSEQPCAWIVQEYLSGMSLSERLKSGIRWSIPEIFGIAIQILDILEELHHREYPVIHRDLKPENIMICRRDNADQVFLIDFGAVANPQVQGGGSTVAGTFGYMPPEQLMGKPEPASDIYALAATIIYMLTGMNPGDMQTHEFRLIIEPHLQAYPPVIMHTLGRMLAPSVKERLTDYAAIRNLFINFSKSNFAEDETELSHFYDSAEYNEKLRNVNALWAAGNLRLWSALPAQTPRAIPKELTHLKSQDLVSRTSILANKYSGGIRTSAFTKFFVLITVTPLLIAFISKIPVLYHNMRVESIGESIGFIIMILTFFIILIAMIWGGLGLGSWKSNLKSSPKKNSAGKSLASLLIKNGEKTIATVVNVQYSNYTSDDIESFYVNNMRECLYLHNIPRFDIYYKFNPPNDSLESDLVHRITIHHAPHEHLNPGDPLPILYIVNPLDSTIVYSMPYPFDIHDVDAFHELVCKTNCGDIKQVDNYDYEQIANIV